MAYMTMLKTILGSLPLEQGIPEKPPHFHHSKIAIMSQECPRFFKLAVRSPGTTKWSAREPPLVRLWSDGAYLGEGLGGGDVFVLAPDSLPELPRNKL